MKKLKKIDFKSLKFKVWLTFVIFAVLIIGLLWISQVIFLSYYTDRYKRNEFTNITRELESAYSDNYSQEFSRIANKHGCMVEVITINDKEYLVEFSTNGLGYGISGEKIKNTAGFEKLLSSVDGYYFNKDASKSTYVYAEYLKDDVLLVISQSTAVADSTVKILQTQMWIATITIIVLAICVSLIMSGTLSKDISQLSAGAKKFAENDLTVVFPEKGTTEIAEISSTLNYAVREVSKVEQLRRELIANVSHDLRTPLTLIKGYAELLRDISGDNKEKREQGLNVIIKESDRLTILVRDMLNLAKLEGKEQEIEKEKISISELIQNSAESFMVLNEKDGFNVSFTVEPDLYVLADQTRLQIATYNLIANAVNYTGEDKVVEINLKKDGDNALFSVRDTGQGISEENKELIWERYFRAKEHKRSVVGSGLGLSIVKTILDAHDAKYGVDSKINEGSTFWYSVPLVKEIEK